MWCVMCLDMRQYTGSSAWKLNHVIVSAARYIHQQLLDPLPINVRCDYSIELLLYVHVYKLKK